MENKNYILNNIYAIKAYGNNEKNTKIIPYTMIVSISSLELKLFYDRHGTLHTCSDAEMERYLIWLSKDK